MVAAYELAKTGGKHYGWYLRQIELTDEELSKGIRSFENQIARHEKWIDDPISKNPAYNTFDSRRKAALMLGWRQDVRRHRECIAILRGILKERKNG